MAVFKAWRWHGWGVVWLCVAAVIGTGVSVRAGDLQPRAAAVKPDHAEWTPGLSESTVLVKLRDGSHIRAAGGRIVRTGEADRAAPANADLVSLAGAVPGGEWHGMFEAVGEARLAAMRTNAERSLKKEVADLVTWFRVELLPGGRGIDAVNALNRLDIVEIAYLAPLPVIAPLPPDYSPSQQYLGDPPVGIGAEQVRALPGGTGAGVRFVDVEYQFNSSHLDLAPVARIGPPAVDPFPGNDHGTAVLGQIVSLNNGFGTTGGAFDAEGRFCPANTLEWGYNPGAAVLVAASNLNPGDIILIEQQVVGPVGEYVPVEWHRHIYDAIVAAVGNGMVVVEAAGNGGQDLDAPVYSTGNGGHHPFLPQNDSGAIIVGAGSPVSRSRLSFSCFGSRVNLQGWGQSVFTTGYGGSYSIEGPNLYYTCCFSGTSSASPIVASACILLQANHRARYGVPLTPSRVREALIASGTAQPDSQSGNIGPLPNVLAAIAHIDSQNDCNKNGIPDPIDIAQGTSDDCNLNGLPDECDLADGYSTDVNGNGSLDDCEGVVLLAPANDAQGLASPIALEWSAALVQAPYRLILSEFPDLSNPLVSFTTAATRITLSPATVEAGKTYYWGVTIQRGRGSYPSTPGVARFTTVVPPLVCRADFSLDGRVDTIDLVMFLGAFGDSGEPGAVGDTNLDGVVNTLDLVRLLGEFGRTDCP